MSPQRPHDGISSYNGAEENNGDRLTTGRFLASPAEGEAVVITGLAGQFPESNNVYHFRDNLMNKVDMVNDDTRRWEHTHPEIPTRGGKLLNITKFDPGFFGVHYKQAQAMCPMVRLHLESAVECIMDAGLHPSDLEGANCGVFVGSSFSETEQMWFFTRLETQHSAVTGCERSMIANRLSYYLKLNGPSYVCDTACSSSFYALEQAYRMIRLGQIECAIVGGSNINLHPFGTLQFARLGALSMDGTCKAFDAKGNGYVRSESISSIFLQKAKVAKRVYCQIVHVKVNNDGYKSEGITYPSGEMQMRMLREVYEECGVDPTDVVFVEAHGTGTKVGDPEECSAIDEIFCKNRKTPLMIGSVKSNTGHTESSSGLASLAKVIIAMETGIIPPNLHYKKAREGVEALERGRLKVVTEKTPLENDNGLIGVSNFGFGGGNSHVLVRWNEKNKSSRAMQDDLPTLVCVSGRTESAMHSLLNSATENTVDAEYIRLLHDVFRKHIACHQFRGYSIVSKHGEIMKVSRYYSEDLKHLYILFGSIQESWQSFGKHLLSIPIFATAIQRVQDVMSKHKTGINGGLFDNKGTASNNNIFGGVVVQMGIIDILNRIGLKPTAVVGDSLGELVCAYYDGVLSAEELILSAATIQNVLTQFLQPLSQYKVKLGVDQNKLQVIRYLLKKMPKQSNSRCKALVATLIEYFERERDNNGLLLPLTAVRELKQMIPTTIETCGAISKNETLISGPKKICENFAISLKNKGIAIEHIRNTVSFMLTDADKIVPQLSKQLKTLVNNQKKKSEKWLTFANNVPAVDYLVQSLARPSKFSDLIKAIPPRSVVVDIGSGSFINTFQKHLAAKKVDAVDMALNDVVSFLDTLGRLYNHGYNFEISKLYPEVAFPVSRGTQMVSPYIKWEHDADWIVFSYKSKRIMTGSRVIIVETSVNDWKFVGGHVVDGRLLFPAAGYLTMVWETFALINNSMTADLAVAFENVKFIRATHIKDGPTEFIVMIQKGSGNFEVSESGSSVVTGTILVSGNADDQVDLPCYIHDEPINMKKKDVYKDLRLRGYNYKGSFKGIAEASLAADRGLVEWDGNWITFIDNMFQLTILGYDSRFLYVPTGIERLTIDGRKHETYAAQFGEKPLVPVFVFQHSDVIKSGGIEVRGMKASSIPRRKARGEPVLEKYVFVPNEMKADVPLSVRINMQICLENIITLRVKAVEVIDECTKENTDPLASHILSALGDLPLIQPTVKVLAKKEITIPNVVVEDGKLNTETECLLVVGSNFLNRTQMLHLAFGSLKDNKGFVISREDSQFVVPNMSSQGIHVLTIHRNDQETILMMRRSSEYQTPVAVDVTDPDQKFSWLPKLQEVVAQVDNQVVVYAQNEPLSGVLGLWNCLRKEPDGAKIRSVFIMDPDQPKFDLQNSFYVEQLTKDLAVNVVKNGKWGTYRHVPLDNLNEIESEHCYVNVTTSGDLSSLRWIQGHLGTNIELPREKTLIHVYNSALNFRDIMTASGRITADVITRDRMEQECVQGVEISGRTPDGRRVAGMATSKALANLVAADTYLLLDIPDTWTLEEAATFPVVYGTVLFSLFDEARMKGGEAVLIHSGAGGVGQAAISVALFHGCKVYTTCGSEEKRAFLKKRFPQLTDRNIGKSHDSSFEQMILMETRGRGVDIVLNSLAEEKLTASVRCLARGGRFVEIGKFDLARDTGLRVALLEKNCSFHTVMLDIAFSSAPGLKRHLHEILQMGINSGAVRPLNAHVFKSHEVEKAFRFMASGKHMGKVVINLREEEQEKVVVPKPMPMKGLPRYSCFSERTYVICGGLGGFGLELADWLIMRGARKLVLTSRSGIRNGYQASRIRLWKSYGVTVIVSTADITTLAGCEQMLRQAESFGPVEAIFNLAVVLKDAIFTNQTADTFKESFGPKAKATKNLDEASRKLCHKLKDFVIFSSVSCGRGNPGQTNYGMANSVMERICEKRKEEGLPALAVEWGAIGDVGLVAEWQEEHTELKIGGTLQQGISSCLQVMDNFLKQDQTVVSSMVVAEKRAEIGSADNVIDAISNILGLSDLKTISVHATLAELGMDSITAVEIKQSLEREFEVYLTSQDIRNMTFARLYEIESEREHEVKKGKKVEILPGGLEMIFRLMGDETSSSIPVIRLPTKLEDGKPGPKVLLLPGIEGVASVLTPLAANLNCHAHCIQFHHDLPEDGLVETAGNLVPQFESLLSKSKPFTIVSYSFGTMIALEVVAMLEQKGYAGTLFLIDGAPKMLFELLKQQVVVESEDQFQTSLLCVLMSLFLPLGTITENRDKIFRANGFEERIKVQNVAEDYNLSEICQNPVQVQTFEGNHITILDNPKVAEAINAQATEESTFN